jgi:hypothetical protein
MYIIGDKYQCWGVISSGNEPLGRVSGDRQWRGQATEGVLDGDLVPVGGQQDSDGRPVAVLSHYGTVFTTVPGRLCHPEQYCLHIVSPDAAPAPSPSGCLPFRLRLDRARDIYCDTRPTAEYFEWIPDSQRLVDTGDFRPTDFTMGRFPPPLNRPVAALLDVTLLNPLDGVPPPA